MSNLKPPYHLTLILFFLGFGVVVALITSFINYKVSFTNLDESLQEISKSEVSFKENYLSGYIRNSEKLLSSIVHSDLIRKFALNDDQESKTNAINLFYALASSNENVMQLRFLDNAGMEIIRVDRSRPSKAPHIIAANDMQDKKDRYYFQESIKLNKSKFWYSNIDLNIEHGEIEQPFKPTFRVATPLIINGKKHGIVIVNLLFSQTIKFLSFSENFNIYLASDDGEVIYNPDSSQSWSKYFDNRKKLNDLFPSAASSIQEQKVYSEPGIYAYSLGSLFENKDNLKIIFAPKSVLIESMLDKNILSALLIALTVLGVSIPLSWLASIIPSRLQSKLSDAYAKIKNSAAFIDKHVMILSTDNEGVITEVNKCYCDTTGYLASEVIGKKQSDFRHYDTKLSTYAMIHKCVLSGNEWEGELKEIDKQGNVLWVHKLITPELDVKGEINSLTTIIMNITDKKNIELLSVTDNLTGLYNRYKLESVLSAESSRSERYKSYFSVIIFDIDFFKNINDTHGHLAGDSVLIHFSKLLKQHTRNTDVISRWGEEEFLIVASNTNLAQAFNLAEKLRQQIESYQFPIVGSMTISSGVAQYIEKETVSELISRADLALYQAKETGRNKVITQPPLSE